jgi:O-antigen/teichoic acid export membrane protein
VSFSSGRRILLNTGALAGSNLWRILVSFLIQLLVARRLGLESLGYYTVAMAYLNVSQVLSEAGLPMLLVRDLAQEPAQRRAVARLALGVQLGAACLVALGLIVLTWLLPYPPPLQAALWLVGASLPFFAITSVGETLFQAGERMEYLLGVEGAINLLILALSLVVLWQGGDVVPLLAVVVVAQVISAALAVWLVARSRLLAPPQVPMTTPAATRLRQAMPFFGLSLADVLLQRLDILLLSAVGGPQVVGIYSAAYNLLRVAIKLIQSFWRALYPTLSRLYYTARPRYLQLAAMGLHYGLLACIGAAALGAALAEEVIQLLYATADPASAAVLRVLVWLMPLFLVESAAITQLLVEQRARASLMLSAAHLLALAALILVLTAVGGAQGAAWGALLAQAIGTGIGLWLTRARRPGPAPAARWPALPAAALAYALASWLPAPWPLQAVAGLGAYLVVLVLGQAVAPADIRRLRQAVRR